MEENIGGTGEPRNRRVRCRSSAGEAGNGGGGRLGVDSNGAAEGQCGRDGGEATVALVGRSERQRVEDKRGGTRGVAMHRCWWRSSGADAGA